MKNDQLTANLEGLQKELSQLQTDSKGMMARYQEKEKVLNERIAKLEEDLEKTQNKQKLSQMNLKELRDEVRGE